MLSWMLIISHAFFNRLYPFKQDISQHPWYSKVHGASMGPIWGRQDPGGPHVGPMNSAIWDVTVTGMVEGNVEMWFLYRKCVWYNAVTMLYFKQKYMRWRYKMRRLALTISVMTCSVILYMVNVMMTSSNGNIFRVTGPVCGEFTGHRWIPIIKASDAELWCFLWDATTLILTSPYCLSKGKHIRVSRECLTFVSSHKQDFLIRCVWINHDINYNYLVNDEEIGDFNKWNTSATPDSQFAW